jgi:hypothetical protein
VDHTTLYHCWKKDQYERIRRLRLIVYHHNLHMWYRVICRGGIRVLLKVLSRWHKWNIWFLHFICFFISIWWYANFLKNLNRNFHFKFQKWKSNFKNEKFQFFHFNFSWHISIFQISIQISKSIFFQNCPFPMANFFQNSKTKIFNSKFKKNVFFKIFHLKLWSTVKKPKNYGHVIVSTTFS